MTTLPHGSNYTDAHGAPHVALPTIADIIASAEGDAPRAPQWRPDGDAVVALDIDGVCNDDAWRVATAARFPGVVVWSPEVGAAMLDPLRVARVQRVCATTDASVVLTTGWRRWASAEDIAACLRAAGLTAPVLGAEGGVKMTADLRQSALHEWLCDHPAVGRWCVIDDLVSAWESTRNVSRRDVRDGKLWHVETSERYVAPWLAGRCVHPVDGITKADTDAAIAILTRAT